MTNQLLEELKAVGLVTFLGTSFLIATIHQFYNFSKMMMGALPHSQLLPAISMATGWVCTLGAYILLIDSFHNGLQDVDGDTDA